VTDDPGDRLLQYHDWCKTVEAGELRDRLEQQPEYRSNRVVSDRVFKRIVEEVSK
jgi:plasmid replication initiation protein